MQHYARSTGGGRFLLYEGRHLLGGTAHRAVRRDGTPVLRHPKFGDFVEGVEPPSDAERMAGMRAVWTRLTVEDVMHSMAFPAEYVIQPRPTISWERRVNRFGDFVVAAEPWFLVALIVALMALGAAIDTARP